MAPFRLAAGFLIAPWVPATAYYAFYAWLASSAGRQVPGSALIGGLVPVLYLATILLWLPFVFLLRRLKRDRMLPFGLGGIAMGVILGVAGLWIGGAPLLDSGGVNLLLIAAALGLAYAGAFWLIAVRKADWRPG